MARGPAASTDAPLNVQFHPVEGELELRVGRQLCGTVRHEQPPRAGRAERVERLVEREVPARRAMVELAAKERCLADEEVGVAREVRETVAGGGVARVCQRALAVGDAQRASL